MKKLSLYDFEKICVDAVRWTGQDDVNDRTRNRAFKVVVKINGSAFKGYGSDTRVLKVVDEIIEFRLLTLSNYKSVYVKFNKNLWDFMFKDVNIKDQFNKDKFNYAKDGWYKNACHDSCWTEGFSLSRMFEYDSTFEILEIGIGKSAYVTDDSSQPLFGIYSDQIQREKGLLFDLVCFESWQINMDSDWDFWNSFMKEMRAKKHMKGFRLQFTNTNNERFKEKHAYVTYDYKGNGIVVTLSESKKNKEVKLHLNPFTKEKCSELFKDMNLNFVTDENVNINEYFGNISERYLRDGWSIAILPMK